MEGFHLARRRVGLKWSYACDARGCCLQEGVKRTDSGEPCLCGYTALF